MGVSCLIGADPLGLENERFGADLWGQNLTSAVMMYVFVLEPCMKQNDRQGSGYIFWLVGQLRCYPRCYTEFMDRRLKYYLFPDVWALLVMLGLNACGIPIAVRCPYLSHTSRHMLCACASVFRRLHHDLQSCETQVWRRRSGRLSV